MGTAIGTYLNLFSDWEKGERQNEAFPMKIDVYLIFPEYMEGRIDFIGAEEIAQSTIKEFSTSAKDIDDLAVLKEKLENALIDYHVQVLVEKLL